MEGRVKAVFFDLDGVLVNSEVLNQSLLREYVEQSCCPVPPKRFHLLIGSHKSLDPWSDVVRGIDLGMSPEEFKRDIWAYRQKRLETIRYEDWIFPETRESLEMLKSMGIRTACASSSSLDYIYKVLGSRRLTEYFDLITTCDNFERSKPAPDIYLYCMKQLGLKPEDCLVTEDSFLGIRAAKSAGIRVAARIDHNFGINQQEADYFVEDLRELVELVRRLCTPGQVLSGPNNKVKKGL